VVYSRGCTSFPRILKPPQNCRDQKGDMKLVPYSAARNIRCHCKKHKPQYSHVGTTREEGVAYPEESLQYNRLIHEQI